MGRAAGERAACVEGVSPRDVCRAPSEHTMPIKPNCPYNGPARSPASPAVNPAHTAPACHLPVCPGVAPAWGRVGTTPTGPESGLGPGGSGGQEDPGSLPWLSSVGGTGRSGLDCVGGEMGPHAPLFAQSLGDRMGLQLRGPHRVCRREDTGVQLQRGG